MKESYLFWAIEYKTELFICSLFMLLELLIIFTLLMYWWFHFMGDGRREALYNKFYDEYYSYGTLTLKQKRSWLIVDLGYKNEVIMLAKGFFIMASCMFVPELGKVFLKNEDTDLLYQFAILEHIREIPVVERFLAVLFSALIVVILQQISLIENGIQCEIIEEILTERDGCAN